MLSKYVKSFVSGSYHGYKWRDRFSTVFIDYLVPGTTQSMLQDTFGRFGRIMDFKIVKKRRETFLKFAFACFMFEKEAVSVINGVTGCMFRKKG